ncbi:MAG: hypothetical protein WAW39_15940 [Prosthecobacter sp.]|uniref:hypothetical protein n=1 Tax=Prosthecobacter sp. TaxID=1965333 RepID=UPI003BB0D452
MQTQPTTTLDPRTEVSRLVNLYAAKTATLNAATADVRAELTALTASLNKIEAPHRAELDKIEADAKALALQHGPEIFGDKKSLTENGYCLAIRLTDVVQCEDEDATLAALMREAVKGSTDADKIAASACVRLNPELNKQYILSQFDDAPEWFAQFNISVNERLSASLKQAPKTRARKATVLKATEQPQQEAAA